MSNSNNIFKDLHVGVDFSHLIPEKNIIYSGTKPEYVVFDEASDIPHSAWTSYTQSINLEQEIKRAFHDSVFWGTGIVKMEWDAPPEENCPFYCTKCGIGTTKDGKGR